jgi:hypothetical protein
MDLSDAEIVRAEPSLAKHAEGMSARSMKSQHITPGAALES